MSLSKLDKMDMSLSKFIVKDREAWHAAVHGVVKSRTLLSNWTELVLENRIISASILSTRKKKRYLVNCFEVILCRGFLSTYTLSSLMQELLILHLFCAGYHPKCKFNIDKEGGSDSVSPFIMSLRLHGLRVAYQPPLSMEFSRQEYWSGCQGIFPDE